jgi:hypothetical protein
VPDYTTQAAVAPLDQLAELERVSPPLYRRFLKRVVLRELASADPLHRALCSLWDRARALKRDTAHFVDETNPDGWRRAARAAWLENAAALAHQADELAQIPIPASTTSKQLVDIRAVFLRKQIDRVARLWTERGGQPESADCERALAALGEVLGRIRA